VPLNIEVRVWSLSTKQRDELSDAVWNSLLANQATTETGKIYGFELQNETDVDEPGKEGVHSKVMTFNYFFVTGS
jgi:hypothetical protein